MLKQLHLNVKLMESEYNVKKVLDEVHAAVRDRKIEALDFSGLNT